MCLWESDSQRFVKNATQLQKDDNGKKNYSFLLYNSLILDDESHWNVNGYNVNILWF